MPTMLSDVLDRRTDGRAVFDAAQAHVADERCERCAELIAAVLLTGAEDLLDTVAEHLAAGTPEPANLTVLFGQPPLAARPTRTLSDVLAEHPDGVAVYERTVALAHAGCGRCEQLGGTLLLTGSGGLLHTAAEHHRIDHAG